MARYGSDWYRSRPRPYHRRRSVGGGGWGGAAEHGYDRPSGRRPGRWSLERPYDPYDYDFGGRGWPYEAGREGTRWEDYPAGYYGGEFYRPGRYRDWRGGLQAGRGRTYGPYTEAYGYGEEYGYGQDYGYGPAYDWGDEYGWGAAPSPAPRPDYGTYGVEYGRPAIRGRYAERYVAQGSPIRYGPTPSSRWPEDGHDVDHLPARERQMDDGEIRDNVKENLFQDTWIDPERIDVDVAGGVVTLEGEVRDFMEARYAWDDAWESAGVRGVINNLTVRTDRPSEEMELPQTSGGQG